MRERTNYVDTLLQALTTDRERFGAILSGKESSAIALPCHLPLEDMLVTHFADAGNEDGVRALALIGSLYLSVVHAGFPKDTFRTAVTYLREYITIPTFNCTHYENLYARLNNKPQITLQLLSGINEFRTITLTKDEIFDAFDFMTNAL